MILYHRTTAEAAERIVTEGVWRSKEQGWIFLSTHRDGYADGYGTVVVAVEVPEDLAELDDEFQTGERHYRVRAEALASWPAKIV